MAGEAAEDSVGVVSLGEFEAVVAAWLDGWALSAELFGGPDFVGVSSFRHEHFWVEATAGGVVHPCEVTKVHVYRPLMPTSTPIRNPVMSPAR